jgi:hypothetical protein
MTKDEYLAALDKNFHEAKRAFLLQIQTMGRKNFLAEASNRWDKRHEDGSECDLETLNLLQEAHQEAHDGIAYRAVHAHLKK